MFPKKIPPPQLKEHPPSVDSSDGDDNTVEMRSQPRKERSESGQMSYHSKYGSKGALHSPIGSMHSFDLQVIQNNQFIYLSIQTKLFNLI